MKTVTLIAEPPELHELLEQARQEDLVVQLADGSEFLLVAVEDFGREIARTRLNERLMAFLEARAQERPEISLGELKRELGLDSSPEPPREAEPD